MFHKKYISVYLLIFGCLIWFDFSCAEREKLNPFDPHGKIYLNLHVVSHNREVELSWDNPNLADIVGFNIHRRQDGVDNSYKIIATNLLPVRRNYIDYAIEYRQRYSYYLTVLGEGVESKPSNIVSITPGPGEAWIVDKWGYQILHNTYDLEHVIARYLTNWPPSDMAIAKNLRTGLILYNDYGIIEAIDLNSMQSIGWITSISHPYMVQYDPPVADFWVIDSTGYLYRIDGQTFQITHVSSIPGKPVQISITEQTGHINIVDQESKSVRQFNRTGSFISEISTIQGQPLQQPERYAESYNLRYFWLVDDVGEWDRIYVRKAEAEDFHCIDSLNAAGDLVPAAGDSSIWIVCYAYWNSSVLQLSASGTRQIELKQYYEPYDIEINPYDETLLVADTRNGRVLHYSQNNDLIGEYPYLNFPVRVIVE